MSISALLSDLVDLDGHKQRAKLKRALREKEIRVLNDLSDWTCHDLGKKRRLQRKCLRIAEHYFSLGTFPKGENPSFQFVLTRLARWHQRVSGKTPVDSMIIDLVGYIKDVKQAHIFKNDQIKLYKLGVLYHQLSVISLSPVLSQGDSSSLSIGDWLTLMKSDNWLTGFSMKLFEERIKRGGAFLIDMSSMIVRAKKLERAQFLSIFFSNELSEFINMLGLCAYEPARLYPDEQSNNSLLELKQKAAIAHAYYCDVWALLLPYHQSSYQDNLILDMNSFERMAVIFSSHVRNQLKDCLHHSAFIYQVDVSPFECLIVELQRCYRQSNDLTRWVDLLISLSEQLDWANRFKMSLSKDGLQSLLDAKRFFEDRVFNEIFVVIEAREDQHPRYKTVKEAILHFIQLYLNEINSRLTLDHLLSFEVIPYDPQFFEVHRDFFERFDRIYCNDCDEIKGKLEALFNAIERDA